MEPGAGRATIEVLRAQIVGRKNLHREDSRQNQTECPSGEVDESDTDSPKVREGPPRVGPLSVQGTPYAEESRGTLGVHSAC